MKNKKTILVILAIVGFLVLLFCLYRLHGNFKDRSYVTSPAFTSIVTLFEKNKSLSSIGVFKENQYVTVNDFTFNLQKRTYGKNPDIGFIGEFYTAADSTPIDTSIEKILEQKYSLNMNESQLGQIKDTMKKIGLTDVQRVSDSPNDLMLYAENSMWGRSGFIIASDMSLYKQDDRLELDCITDTICRFFEK